MSDENYKSYWGEKGLRILGWAYPAFGLNPKSYSDILKFSLCYDTRIERAVIYCGTENCSDAVRGSDYRWVDCTFNTTAPSLGALTIKGAIDGWKVMGCTFDGHGDEFDIELGQYDKYWYIGRQPTKNGEIIDSGAIDGKPLKVLVWNAEIPKVVRSNVKIVKIPGLLWFPYFCFCYLRDKLRKDR